MTRCSGHFMKIRFDGIRCRKLIQLIVALRGLAIESVCAAPVLAAVRFQ